MAALDGREGGDSTDNPEDSTYNPEDSIDESKEDSNTLKEWHYR